MSFSLISANQTLDAYLRGQPLDVPEGVYVSLHTADPGKLGADEITGAAWPGYTRQDSAAGADLAGAWTAAAEGISRNTRQMLFPANDGDAQVIVTHFALWDAPAGGRCLFHGSMASPRTIFPTDELVIYPDALTVRTLEGEPV
jgi:hypothetical protein